MFSFLKKHIVGIIAVLVAIASAGAIMYPFISNWVAERQVQSVVSTYSTNVDDMSDELKAQLWNDAVSYNNTLGSNNANALADPFDMANSGGSENYLKMLNSDGSGVMCFVEIPSINVYLPVYHGTSDDTLMHGAGHLEGSSLPVGGENTHCVISGHTGVTNAKMFTDLVNLTEGSRFYLHTLGQTLAYQVDSIDVVLPTDISGVQIVPNQDLCTLVTCTPYGINTHRLLVRGFRIPYVEEEHHEEELLGKNAAAQSEWVAESVKAFLVAFGCIAIIAMLNYIFLEPIKRKKEKQKRAKERASNLMEEMQSVRTEHRLEDLERQNKELTNLLNEKGKRNGDANNVKSFDPITRNIYEKAMNSESIQEDELPAIEKTLFEENTQQSDREQDSSNIMPDSSKAVTEQTVKTVKKKKKRSKKFLRIAGSLILIAGLLIYFAPDFYAKYIDYNSQKEIARISEMYGDDAKIDETAGNGEESVDESKRENAELYDRIIKYNKKLFESEQEDLTDAWSLSQPSIDLGIEDDLFGYIKIPAMDVKLPLYFGASEKKMAKGAVILGQTSLPVGGKHSNSVIAAHRGYRGAPFFREIEKIKKGDKVIVRNPWEKLTYVAYDIKIIDPNDAEKILIQEGKDILTLITCHPYRSHGKQRYLVYCKRADKIQKDSESNVETDPEDVESSDADSSDEIENSSKAAIEQENKMRVALAGCIAVILIITLIPSKKKRMQNKEKKEQRKKEKEDKEAEKMYEEIEKRKASEKNQLNNE